MEFLNKIEIKGIVGRCEMTSIHETNIYHMSVVTEHCHLHSSGSPVIETMWHNVTCAETKENGTVLGIEV